MKKRTFIMSVLGYFFPSLVSSKEVHSQCNPSAKSFSKEDGVSPYDAIFKIYEGFSEVNSVSFKDKQPLCEEHIISCKQLKNSEHENQNTWIILIEDSFDSSDTHPDIAQLIKIPASSVSCSIGIVGLPTKESFHKNYSGGYDPEELLRQSWRKRVHLVASATNSTFCDDDQKVINQEDFVITQYSNGSILEEKFSEKLHMRILLHFMNIVR